MRIGWRLRGHRTNKASGSHLSARDLVTEAVAGLLGRPGRSLLTAIGTVVGVGAFAALSGLTITAQAQVNQGFNALAATEVTVADTQPQDTVPAFPPNAGALVKSVPGVVASGLLWTLSAQAMTAASALAGASTAQASGLGVVAATPGEFSAVQASLASGDTFSPVDNRYHERVAVLGVTAAASLGITVLDGADAVYLDGVPFTVVGIVGNVSAEPALLGDVIVPVATAEQYWGPPAQGSQADVRVRAGAATEVGHELPVLLQPGNPHRLSVVTNSAPFAIQGTITRDLSGLLWLVAGVALAISVVGIGATMLMAVNERVYEIGLRRAIGASRRHIAAQFLAESTALGLYGGLAGACLGIFTIVLASWAKGWAPVIQPWMVVVSPFIGMATGILAGLYPAIRAGRLSPVEALRR